MKYIKRYKYIYSIYQDNQDRYLCRGDIKVRIYYDSDLGGYNVSQAEETMKFAQDKEDTFNRKSKARKLNWNDKKERNEYYKNWKRNNKLKL